MPTLKRRDGTKGERTQIALETPVEIGALALLTIRATTNPGATDPILGVVQGVQTSRPGNVANGQLDLVDVVTLRPPKSYGTNHVPCFQIPRSGNKSYASDRMMSIHVGSAQDIAIALREEWPPEWHCYANILDGFERPYTLKELP